MTCVAWNGMGVPFYGEGHGPYAYEEASRQAMGICQANNYGQFCRLNCY